MNPPRANCSGCNLQMPLQDLIPYGAWHFCKRCYNKQMNKDIERKLDNQICKEATTK